MRRRFLGLLLLLPVLAGACKLADSKTNEQGVIMSGGVVEDAKFIGCLTPGSVNNNIGFGSDDYVYRIDQRTFIAGGTADQLAPGADTPEVEVVSQDNIRLRVPFQLYFKLNRECDPRKGDGGTFVKFHNNLGTKTEAWVGGGGDPDNPDAGWDAMLNQYFRPQIERSLERAALQFPWLALYSSEEARRQMQDATVLYLKDAVREVIGDDYFCGPAYDGPGTDCGNYTMTIGKPTPVNPAVAAGREGAEASKGRLVEQEQENARASKELEQRRQEIAALGPDNYVLLEGIKSGKVQFIVVPKEGANVNIPTPGR